ncbi:hypothetical protein DV702_04380 [Sporosarcina sp. PTS2304]|uniref:hypothetical protein n=1 Tax=Sporosarcina sp. PTS2304 TaxID=2283194 RepID=UPI000E0D8793|nr:hypothetical protein [Sporosarcina sp. PTS2304]AXH99036.1 hypothetical protein DV702_04380 [Sporosarcina sp. PTS2304]
MKRFLVLVVLFAAIVGGCSPKEVTVKEIKVEKGPSNVKNYVENSTTFKEGTGIHVIQGSDDKRYVYIDQNFLDDGKGFGEMKIITDDDSWNIHLTEDEKNDPTETYKLYKIQLDKEYEYMRVFKNGEETHFQSVGS